MTKATKPAGLLLAAVLMASTAPAALAQTTGTDSQMGSDGTTTGGGSGMGADMPGTGADTGGMTGATGHGTGDGTGATGTGAAGTGMDGATGTGAGATVGAGAASRDDGNHQHLVVSLNAAAAMDQDWATRLDSVSEDTDVTVLERSEIADAEGVDGAMFDQALSDLEGNRDAMRSAVEERQHVVDALEEEGHAAEDVIGLVVYGGVDSEIFVIVEGSGGN